MIYISQAAIREIERIKLSRQQPESRLRLQVKTGGCSGLFYDLQLESTTVNSNFTSHTDDLCYENNGLTVVIDPKSYSYIKNLKLDYSEDLMGGGFRFQNPQANVTCGCGLSFSVS